MRKSDKLKNLKKTNLLVENRYLESKGIVRESNDIIGNDFELIYAIKNKAELGQDASNEFFELQQKNTELYDKAVELYGKLVQPNVRKDTSVPSLDENLTTQDSLISAIESKLKEIEDGKSPKGIGDYLDALKNMVKKENMNPEIYSHYFEKYKDVIRLSKIGLDLNNGYTKYEEIKYVGQPKTFSNGRTVNFGDKGQYIGSENGEECWVSFPASGFLTTFRNIEKIGTEESGLEESSFLSGAKDFGNRLLGITGKKQEAEKQKAIEEINLFDFKRLFIQTNNLELGVRNALANRLQDAAGNMPTLAKLDEALFNTNGIDGEHVYMMSDKGEKLEGFIPRQFFMIKGQGDLIDNDTARTKLKAYLNFM